MATPAATTAATAPPRWRSLYPFASNWLETSAGRLHYVDVGPDGRADELGDEQADPSDRGGDQGCVLFVHGNPTWSFHWRDAITRLRADHRCVAVDHLGCGLSDKPPRRFRLADRIEHVVRLIDELDLRAITLVAQDWGGAIGLGATLQRPDRLRRIVLLNTGAFTPRFVPRRIAVCRTPVVGRVALQGAGLFSRAALRMTMSRRPLPADVAGGYLAPYDSWANRRAVYEFVADIPTSPRHPTWQTLAEIEQRLPTLAGTPSLLVWGMKDWCFDPSCLERFRQVWPDARAVELADAGHWVMEDATDDVLQAIGDFLVATEQPAEAPA